jgi:hypothetical protein
MRLLSSLTALILTCTCGYSLAQWQWLDKDGRKVFSDRAPPPEIADKNILKRPGGKAGASSGLSSEVAGTESVAPVLSLPASSAKPAGLEKELETKKKQAADAEAAKRKAEEDRVAKAKVENCARAKQAKVTLDSGIRIAQTSASGERQVMDDAARNAETKRVQGVIDADCK